MPGTVPGIQVFVEQMDGSTGQPSVQAVWLDSHKLKQFGSSTRLLTSQGIIARKIHVELFIEIFHHPWGSGTPHSRFPGATVTLWQNDLRGLGDALS